MRQMICTIVERKGSVHKYNKKDQGNVATSRDHQNVGYRGSCDSENEWDTESALVVETTKVEKQEKKVEATFITAIKRERINYGKD